MTYPARISLQRPHCRQINSKIFTSDRAPEICAPSPLSGMAARSLRIIPPTPNFMQLLWPRSSRCSSAHATNAGLNPSPESTSHSSVSPSAEIVRAQIQHYKCCWNRNIRPALAQDHKIVPMGEAA